MSVEQKIVEPFLARVDQVLGAGYSAVLYGSAARGEHQPEVSDVNLMLVVPRLDHGTLRGLGPAFSGWVANEIPPPLILLHAEWQRASDVFPIEIADMKSGYRVLRGEDPVVQLRVRARDLRPALEREFRGKLARLRQGFIPSESRPEDLGVLARQSIGSVVALYRGLLSLAGRPVPQTRVEVLAAAGVLVGFDPAPLVEIVRHRAERDWRSTRELFEGYLAAVERTVSFVDTFHSGEQE
jgi:hypothetical protein